MGLVVRALVIVATLAPYMMAASAIDLCAYTMAGSNGGRGGLPSVKLWLPQSVMERMSWGEHGWNDPDTKTPTDMHYSGWRFWQFGVSDALLQLLSEQATDPSKKAAHLGRYFGKLHNSSMTGWSSKEGEVPSIEIDTGEPVTESVRSDHYITYGLSRHLFFNGTAKFKLVVDKAHKVSVQMLSSTLPRAATEKLSRGLASLSGHPLFSFPADPAAPESVELIAEFAITRKPGLLESRSR